VVAVVGKLVWAIRWRTGLLVAMVGVGVLLGGGMALANVPPGDTGSGTTPPADSSSGTTPSTDTGSGTTPSGDTGSGTTPSGDTGSGTNPSGDTGSGNTPPHNTPSGNTPKLEYAAMTIAPSKMTADKSAELYSFIRVEEDLHEAKKRAWFICDEIHFKQNCQGAVWVRNGWLAFAAEHPPKHDPPRAGYKLAYGFAYGVSDYKARRKALDSCSANDPDYGECRVVESRDTERPFTPGAFDGGTW
jgi:Domain of unknown function (DUF4189)